MVEVFKPGQNTSKVIKSAQDRLKGFRERVGPRKSAQNSVSGVIEPILGHERVVEGVRHQNMITVLAKNRLKIPSTSRSTAG